MIPDFEALSEAEECARLSRAFNTYFDSRFSFREVALLIQNIEALLLVMKENCANPDSDDFVNALDLISTVALRLKYNMLSDMASWLCASNDLGPDERREAIEASLKIVKRMRAWALRHPF